MITNPVRNYLILLFIAIVGIGGYMIMKQNNDDFDNTQAQAGQSLKATPVPTAATSPAASAGNPTTAINTTAEATSIDTLLSDIPDTDFNDSTLTSTSLGF